jgi:hypothetical protein
MMEETLVTYFDGEKQGALLIAAFGVAGIVLAAVLFPPRWELRSFAVTLGLVGLFELALGVGLLLRTGPQVSGLLAQLGTDAARFFSDECSRMARVQRSFVVAQYVEMAVIVVAAVTAFAQKNRFWVAGIALALLCHAAFLLAFDLVAERRGAVYQGALEARAEPGRPAPPAAHRQ